MYQHFFKTIVDRLLALLALLLLWPVLLLLALLVAVKLGRPVLFSQPRPGLGTKTFYLYKFRSMTNDCDADGKLLPNEQRLTAFGKRLRNTSLDELPSLLNVLKGDVSLVGPRPLRVRYLPYYSKEQQLRHTVRPGITGLAQVTGRVGLNWDEKLALDVHYVKHMSFLQDVKILLLTFYKVFKRNNVTTQTGENFEQPFDDYVKAKGGPDA